MELTVKLDMSGIDKLYSKLEGAERTIRVGVLDSPENAFKASLAEYGFLDRAGQFVKPRSTIRLPLENNIEAIYKEAGAELKDFTSQEIDEAVNKLGESALKYIDEGFATQGYGEWADNKPATIAKKGRNSPEIDTGELRGSYSYEEVK